MSTSITRRSALTAAAVAAVGGVAGYLWGRSSDAATAVSGSSGYGAGTATGTALIALDRVPDGGGVITHGVVVLRSGSAVHAFSARCTHLGCPVNRVSGGKIFCPCHGSVFDAATGAVLQSPASAPLSKVAVTVKDGEVRTT